MVASLLVDPRIIEDGRRFLGGLVRDGFEVTVAFWVRAGENGPWHLYIASPEIIPGSLGVIAPRIYDHVRRVASPLLEYSQIRLIPETDPAARDAIELRDRPPGGDRPFEVTGEGWFGHIRHCGAYVYERISAALTRDEVIQKVLGLMDRPVPSRFVQRNGSVIEGIPLGLVQQSPGATIRVGILNAGTNNLDYVSADEVAAID